MGSAAPDYNRRVNPMEDHSTIVPNEPDHVRIPTYQRNRAIQTSLFARNEPQKVVPIGPEKTSHAGRREPARRPQSQRPTNYASAQQRLLFTPSELEAPRAANTSIEAVIYCSDPVASIIHRLLATVADLAMIAIATALFAIAFCLAGGEILLNRQTWLIYASIPLIIALFYKYLWAIAGADSPGMKWAGLRTVDFDGKKPEVMQRFLRLAGGFLGLAATGIGLIWAFVDEETLTWHDHISNTFTTPAQVP